MDVLTYDEIREAERKEKEAQGLANLSVEFIDRYGNYLADKRKVLEKSNNNFIANKIKEQSEKELVNARESFQRLFALRAKKLVEQAFMDLKMGTNLDTKNLLDFEKSDINIKFVLFYLVGSLILLSYSLMINDLVFLILNSLASGQALINLIIELGEKK